MIPFRFLSISLLFFTSAFTLHAADITWLEKDYDFGIIEENGGKAKGECRFVNTGNEPVLINAVTTTCGCTEIEYPEEVVNPGDTAHISFSFNPIGRPGKFDKTLKAYIGKEEKLHRINLKGVVAASEATIENRFPYKAGNLCFENINLLAGELPKGARRHLFLRVYNNGPDTITPVWKTSDSCIEVSSTPTSIPPKEAATLSFYIDTARDNMTGTRHYTVKCENVDPDIPPVEITVRASILP